MSFAALKKNRAKSFEQLVQATEKLNGNNNTDDRFWKPSRDKAGNGYAIIRFLPAAEGEDFAFIRKFDHGFQGPGGWLIEECPTTDGIERDCPVCEYNRELWNAGGENSPQRKQASDQKRRTKFISNILVIDDPANPENNGKVFLFSYGVKIFEKIQRAIKPDEAFKDEQPIDPFSFWDGADFKLKIRGKGRDTSYDDSSFEKPSKVGTDKECEAIYDQLIPIQTFVAEENYKTYEQLDARLNKVLGLNRNVNTVAAPSDDTPRATMPIQDEDLDTGTADSVAMNTADDDDDDMALFERLANE